MELRHPVRTDNTPDKPAVGADPFEVLDRRYEPRWCERDPGHDGPCAALHRGYTIEAQPLTSADFPWRWRGVSARDDDPYEWARTLDEAEQVIDGILDGPFPTALLVMGRAAQ